jgi:hypothetical protein
MGGSRLLVFHGAMREGKEARFTDTIDWYVEPDQAASSVAAAPTAGRSRASREQKLANSVGLAVATSLLFVLLMAAVLVGGHAAIAPLLGKAAAARASKGVGDVVFTMPDGVFCRHMSFNNATAEVNEGDIERCPDPIGGGPGEHTSRFEWGGH